jgi:hypothetical protein
MVTLLPRVKRNRRPGTQFDVKFEDAQTGKESDEAGTASDMAVGQEHDGESDKDKQVRQQAKHCTGNAIHGRSHCGCRSRLFDAEIIAANAWLRHAVCLTNDRQRELFHGDDSTDLSKTQNARHRPAIVAAGRSGPRCGFVVMYGKETAQKSDSSRSPLVWRQRVNSIQCLCH